MTSASWPGSSVPMRSIQPMISAFSLVAEVIAAIDDSPRMTRTSSSRA
jgi:hypothetical protein